MVIAGADEMAEYESLAHLSRWRRTVIWFCEDKVGFGITTVVFCALNFGPLYWLGWWWLVVVAALWGGFALGYNTAKFWAKRGEVPPDL